MSRCPFANLIDPDIYANGMPYEELKRIRDDGPVHYMEDPTRGVPYWLVTGRDEIDFISKNPGMFSSEARSALADEFTEEELETIQRHMTINQDPPRQLKSRTHRARDLHAGGGGLLRGAFPRTRQTHRRCAWRAGASASLWRRWPPSCRCWRSSSCAASRRKIARTSSSGPTR